MYFLNNKAGNLIGDKGILGFHAFPNLTHLSLSRCGLTADGVRKLSNTQISTKLKELHLSIVMKNIGQNRLTNLGTLFLKKFRNLVKLNLANCDLLDGVLENFL